MNKILVTGVNGFVGPHMVRELKRADIFASGVGREAQPPKELEGVLDEYISCDLADVEATMSLPLKQFSAVISLAGLANVAESFREAELYEKVNVAILDNLISAISQKSPTTRLVAVSTGGVYDSHQPMPLHEDSKLVDKNKTSPYVKSKLHMEEIAQRGVETGVDCLIARPFNHTGPGQKPSFLVPSLCSKIIDAVRTKEPVTVGNLATRRDFTDVRDVVHAYRLLATLPKDKLTSHTYNICSGESKSGQEIVDIITGIIPGAKDVQLEVDQSLIRDTDPVELVGSSKLLQTDTGWAPEIPLDKTIQDLVSSLG